MGLIHDFLEPHRQDYPDKTALIFGERTSSYEKFVGATLRTANGLLDEGVGTGFRVAYLGKNSDHFFELLFAAGRVGAILTPVNWRLTSHELRHIIDDLQPTLIFVETAFQPGLETAENLGVRLPKSITLDGETPDSYMAWRDSYEAKDPCVAVTQENPLIIIYTSGTTGHPKGATLSHRALTALREIDVNPWAVFQSDDVLTVDFPVFHVSGLIWGLNALLSGATTIVHPEFSLDRISDAMKAHGLTQLLMVPEPLKMLLDHAIANNIDFSSLRLVGYGGAPMGDALIRSALEICGCNFHQGYGMTETAGALTALGPDDHDPRNPGKINSVGKAREGVEICIRDVAGKNLAAGVLGEIYVRTPSIMSGYLNKASETATVLSEDGWYRTGDAGKLDADGYLHLHDRIKDMIISGGENIYPAEIERVLLTHSAITEVAVIGVPSEQWGEEAKALIILNGDKEASALEISTFAKERLAGYKVPKSIKFVDDLPRTSTGKVAKSVLRDIYRSQ